MGHPVGLLQISRKFCPDNNLPSSWNPQKYADRLPGSIKDLQLENGKPLDLNTAVSNVFAVFLVLRLMRLGHPASRPYYAELCGEEIVHAAVDQCQENLFQALQRYGASKISSYRPVHKNLTLIGRLICKIRSSFPFRSKSK